MKKLLLSATLLASALISTAQNQPEVPNGNFENWLEAECGDAPTGYSSIADQIFETEEVCPTSAGITKSTTSYSGNNAVELKSAVYMGTTIGNLIAVEETFNGRPTKLVGYTKFTKGGTDVLNVFVGLAGSVGAGEEIEIAYGETSITATQSGYTKFEITLDYFDNTTTPTFLYIGFEVGTSSTAIDEDGEEVEILTGNAGTVALIDALSFEYPTTTATVNYSAISPINVYAANKNINFSESVSDINVVDMVGAQKMNAADAKTLNAASLTAGMYIVTYKYNNAYFSKKIVIE